MILTYKCGKKYKCPLQQIFIKKHINKLNAIIKVMKIGIFYTEAKKLKIYTHNCLKLGWSKVL